MKRKSTGLLMLAGFLMFCFAFVGSVDADAATEYKLWVNGKEFTSEQTSIECGEGTATFDNASKTLTLENATITQGDENNNAIFYNAETEKKNQWDWYYPALKLNIVLVGENSITFAGTSDKMFNGIVLKGANSNSTELTVSGEGSLAIKSEGFGESAIKVDTLTVKSTVNVLGEFKKGFELNGNLSLKDANVKIATLYGENVRVGAVAIQGVAGNYTDSKGVTVDNSKLLIITSTSDKKYGGVGFKGIGYLTTKNNSEVAVNPGKNGNVFTKTTNPTLSLNGLKIIASTIDNNFDIFTKDNYFEDAYHDYMYIGPHVHSVANESVQEVFMPRAAVADGTIVVDGSEIVKSFGKSRAVKEIKFFKGEEDVTETVTYNYDESNNKVTFTMPDYSVRVAMDWNGEYNSKISKLVAKLAEYNKVKLAWTKVADADGYKVCSTYLTKVACKYVTTNNVTLNGTGGREYNIAVTPYILNDGGKELSKYSETITITTLNKLAAPKVSKYKNGSIKINWVKGTGDVAGYQISISARKNGTNIVRNAKNTSTSYWRSVNKNVKRYYKVRSYTIVDGKKIYAPWSTVKAFTLK